MISMDTKKRLIESAKKDKAGKDFIISVYGLIPVHEQDKKDFEEIGFLSLSEFIQSSAGLLLDSETFVKLAFAYWAYRHQACRVINYLVTEEKWHALLEHIPADYISECGGALGDKGGDMKSSERKINKPVTKGGTSKAYILLRLKKDNSAKAIKLYKQIQKGEISAAKAAIAMGWKKTTATITKDVDSAVNTLKKLFTKKELKLIKDKI